MKTDKKIRMLYWLGPQFTGFDLAALTEDAELGMKHLTGWYKVAMVSDHPMINTFTRFFGYLLSSEVRVFKNAELENAKKWVIEK